MRIVVPTEGCRSRGDVKIEKCEEGVYFQFSRFLAFPRPAATAAITCERMRKEIDAVRRARNESWICYSNFSLRFSVTLVPVPHYTLEQAFLKMRAGQLEFLLVFENAAGARHRETLTYPTRNSIEAVRRAAKHLAYRADVAGVKGVRFRREERGELKDDASLKRIFENEFEAHAEDNDEWD